MQQMLQLYHFPKTANRAASDQGITAEQMTFFLAEFRDSSFFDAFKENLAHIHHQLKLKEYVSSEFVSFSCVKHFSNSTVNMLTMERRLNLLNDVKFVNGMLCQRLEKGSPEIITLDLSGEVVRISSLRNVDRPFNTKTLKTYFAQ